MLGKAPGNSVGNFHMVKMQHTLSTIVLKAAEWHFAIDPEKHHHLMGWDYYNNQHYWVTYQLLQSLIRAEGWRMSGSSHNSVPAEELRLNNPLVSSNCKVQLCICVARYSPGQVLSEGVKNLVVVLWNLLLGRYSTLSVLGYVFTCEAVIL